MKIAGFMAFTLLCAVASASIPAQAAGGGAAGAGPSGNASGAVIGTGESMNPAARGAGGGSEDANGLATGRSSETTPNGNGALAPAYDSSNPTHAKGENPFTGVPVGQPLQHNDLGTPSQSE